MAKGFKGITSKPGFERMCQVWGNMKNRCYRKSTSGYDRYGGRGIKVCNEWLTFGNFYKDMYPSYKKGLTIDRVDNGGDYSFKNCKWSTRKEQGNNKSNNRRIFYKGSWKNRGEWIEELGLKSSTVRQRFYVYNWSISECFEGKN